MGSDRGGGTFLNTNKLLLTLGGREYILTVSFFLYEYTWNLEKSCWGENNKI